LIGHLGFLNQVSNQISLQVAHFDPDLVAHFHPESLAHFNPESLAHFHPEYPFVALFIYLATTIRAVRICSTFVALSYRILLGL